MEIDEHKRYSIFKLQLESKTISNSSTIDDLISVALNEPDISARGSMLGLIANVSTLSKSQIQFLANHPAFIEPFLQKVLTRRRLLLELSQGGLTDELFNACLSSRDGVLHRKLLSIPLLTHTQLLLLCDGGANKAVRNIAKERAARKGPN
jgi:hypothetical protein